MTIPTPACAAIARARPLRCAMAPPCSITSATWLGSTPHFMTAAMSPKASCAERAARPPHLVARGAVQHARPRRRPSGASSRLDLGALPVDLLGEAVEADQERGAASPRARPRAARPRRAARARRGSRSEPMIARAAAARVLQAVEARDDEAVDVGARAQLHGRLHDDAERAERADEELRQIVAGDVLHDLAAAAHEGAVGHDHGEPDEQVARGAVEMAARARGVAGEDAAERRALGARADRASSHCPRCASSPCSARERHARPRRWP